MDDEMKEALEIAGRWKDESAHSFGASKTLGILSRALLAASARPEGVVIDRQPEAIGYMRKGEATWEPGKRPENGALLYAYTRTPQRGEAMRNEAGEQ